LPPVRKATINDDSAPSTGTELGRQPLSPEPRPIPSYPLRIAMIGQRGVPATFGGIERHVEELGAEMVSQGHSVTVFCRTHYVAGHPARYRGMELRYLPSVNSKHLETLSHSLASTLAALPGGFDIVHYHALGPGLVAPLPRWLSRAKVVQSVHGRDDLRDKWGPVARTVLGMAGWMSSRVPDATIAVSRDLAEYYRSQYRRAIDYIPNGVVPPRYRPPSETLAAMGLRPRSYVLFVGRLVPEKAPDLLIQAFQDVAGDVRLAIVGGSNHTTDYVRRLHSMAAADPRVVMLGYRYGDALDELYSQAAVFVLPSSVEGLPLTLLEAASRGLPLVASDLPPHREIVGAGGPGWRLFVPGDRAGLAAAMRRVLQDLDGEARVAGASAEVILSRFCWQSAAASTLQVYRRVLAHDARSRKTLESAAQ